MKGTIPLVGLAALVVLSACSLNNTRMIQVWANPEMKVQPIHFNKILVVAVAPNNTERRSAEDAMVNRIGPKATPSYNLLSDDEINKSSTTKAALRGSDFDGIIVLRWLGVRQEKEIMASPTYSPMWDHYSYSWSYMQESTVVQWKILQLETRIYSVKDEKLIWSGTTETAEPQTIQKVINDVADVVRKQLRKQGLLANPKKEKTK
ncbi:MAG: hypothetical protein IPN90_09905 [Elusimicrobia bacterium]|nr:hypothetical protein [Elusimicrobiota bacterium]